MAHAFLEASRVPFQILIEESLVLRVGERTARDQLLQDGRGHWEAMNSPLYIVNFDASSVKFCFIDIRDFDIPSNRTETISCTGRDKLFSVVKSTIGAWVHGYALALSWRILT